MVIYEGEKGKIECYKLVKEEIKWNEMMKWSGGCEDMVEKGIWGVTNAKGLLQNSCGDFILGNVPEGFTCRKS